MSLIRKACYFWLVLLIGCIIVYAQRQHAQRLLYLPITEPILTVVLPNETVIERKDTDSPWYVDGALGDVQQIETLLNLLRQPCRAVYNQQDIDVALDQQHLPFNIGEKVFVLGDYQALSNTYYIFHSQKVYLCHESFQFYLNQPKQKWVVGQ